MDRVGFGRALGTGAREAAKALMKAADAATAPDPGAGRKPAPPASRPVVGAVVAEKVSQARVSAAGVKRGGKKFGEAVWGPVAKASGILWLEITGVLFGMFAIAAGIAVWRDRGDLRGVGAPMHQAWFAVVMFGVFAYFTVSSYVRAARKGRR